MPPHELHLTIDADSVSADTAFQTWCKENGAKYVKIELPEGALHATQPMLGRWFTSEEDAMKWGKASVQALKDLNIRASRLKIETITSQFSLDYICNSDEYWEFHIKIHFNSAKEKDGLSAWIREFEPQSHLSRSALGVQPKEGHGFYNFVTLRLFEMTRADAEARLERLADRLTNSGLNVVSVQKELCVYDSNKDLDAGWL